MTSKPTCRMKLPSFIIICLLLSQSSLAQHAEKIGEVYQVPFATSGNWIELEVSNIGESGVENVQVIAASVPDWVELASIERIVNLIESGEEAVATFEFDVLRDAPIGESATLLFEVRSGSDLLREKEFVIAVEAPTKVALDQNYPNPFNPETTIGFDLPIEGQVSLVIFDMLGRQVTRLLNEDRGAGHHKIRWNASNLASGTYFYILKAEGRDGEMVLLRNRMVLVK